MQLPAVLPLAEVFFFFYIYFYPLLLKFFCLPYRDFNSGAPTAQPREPRIAILCNTGRKKETLAEQSGKKTVRFADWDAVNIFLQVVGMQKKEQFAVSC